jgi:putative lysine transport system permease protein
MLKNIWAILQEYGSTFVSGIGVTLALALIGTIFGLFFSLILTILRVQVPRPNDSRIVKILKRIASGFARFYVTIFRGTPMIVQAVIFFYSFYQMGIKWSPFAAGLFTVSLNTAAYLTEVLRGGITSIEKGQVEAARSIGMTHFQTFIYIVFPQAIKNSFASIGNEFIVNIKDTAVLSTIMVVDIFSVANKAAGKYYLYVEAMIIAALIYLTITYITSKVLILIEKKLKVETKEIVSSN